MEISNLIPHIEALIFASEKPLTTLEITDLINNAFGFMEDKITLDQIESAIEGILEKYKAEFYPFEVRESGGGWQFLTKRDFHKTVAQLNGDKFLKRLSTAALETLSIIAYKQPVTKSEIEAIRGVSSDYAIQKLLEKDLIVITGRNENLPGHPLVYATSKNFMDYFGLNSPEDLPKLKEVFDDSIVTPTTVEGANAAAAAETAEEVAEELLPSENGTYLNGTEVTFTAEEGDDEGAIAAEGQQASDMADENELADDTYEEDTDEEAIAEEAEALDEEADEVLDEIEEGYEDDEEEASEGFEAEEPYITPEEEDDEYAGDDSTSFKVDDNGELIEEHTGSEEEADEEKEEFDEEEMDEEEADEEEATEDGEEEADDEDKGDDDDADGEPDENDKEKK
ncbi:SMC-Scp complex subunit ScpB [Longitalea arenae]|uniref:SMC-Scp complex subunit ScpB n=1 Tax=Longitalea arenae TaxID=2812558 RepID=UPI0019687BB4|nr:SMC-Scp complex subunit ScpB [Longitalea arenae]